MLNFEKTDGRTIQYNEECHIKLSKEEFEEKYNKKISYFSLQKNKELY